MSKRKSKVERAARKNALKCPKCKSRDIQTKDYPDALLHLCQACQYPVRVPKDVPDPEPAPTLHARQEAALATAQPPRWWEVNGA